MRRQALIVTALLAAGSVTGAQSFPSTQATQALGSASERAPELSLSHDVGPALTTYRATVGDTSGPGFVLLGQACARAEDFELGQAIVFGTKTFAPGDEALEVPLDNALLEALPPLTMHFAAVVATSSGELLLTRPKPLLLGAFPCETLGFNSTPGGGTLTAGEEVTEQWASIGLHISADNKVPGHPDKVIIFDSSNPTPTDKDLQTPGYGDGNDTALGNLLIVAENDADADTDGLVDEPDDEAGGGIITMEFDAPVTFCGIRLVDLDDGGGSEIRFFDAGGTQIDTVALTPGGDNSVQSIGSTVPGVSRMEVDFVSSGGIAGFDFVFCPTELDFDFSTVGNPAGLVAGEPLDEQLAPMGIHVSATSFGPHDQAILFDTNDPTGGDFDLGTADQGLVLIVAENTTDTDGDGNVDVPDDEVAGGVLIFEFDYDVLWDSATVLDIDLDELAFFDAYAADDSLLATVALLPLGDGSIQTVEPGIAGVRRLELTLSSSGALADLGFCPLLFDETPK